MKKCFFPTSMGHLFLYLVSVLFAGIGIYITTLGLIVLLSHNEYRSFLLIVPGLVSMLLFSFVLIYNLHNRIILTDDKIIVTGHWIINNEGLQFPDEIEYDEINDIAIICANANSLKKKITRSGYSSLRPFIFYELTLKSGETKWIFLECFSIKQRKQMLAVINNKTGLNFSYEQLEQKDYSIYKKVK